MNGSEAVDYATLPRRLLAALIDNLTWLIAISWLLAYVPESTIEDHPEAFGIAIFVGLSLWFNYFAICEWRWGQTIGKNAVGIEVRAIDRSHRLSFGQASIRNLLRLVDFFLIGWLMIAAGARKQRLGDKAAKTVVLRKPPKAIPGAPRPATIAGAAASVAPQPQPTAPPPSEPGRALPPVPWTLGQTFWLMLAGFALALFSPVLVLPLDPDLSSDGALLAAQGLFELSLLFVAIGAASEWRAQPLGTALSRLGLRRAVPKDFGLALLTLLVYYIGAALFASLVLQPEQEDIGGELGVGDPNLLIAISAVLVIALLAPVTEELFFRGFVFAGLRSRWSLWPAALVVGLIFGIVHAPTGLTAVVPLAGLGVALCWLYDRTGSLWPCVVAHGVNNGLALLVVS
ncbi:MAG: CPBP family glutamic-type intramembrane protease [Solirubrobacterales bacterium]